MIFQARRLLPLFDRVLVQRMVAETKTKGGLLIPEKAQGKVLEATVVAVGPGLRNEVIIVHVFTSANCCHVANLC